MPDPCDLMGVPAKSSKVPRYAVVGIVAPHLHNQLGMLVGDRPMSVCPTPVGDRRQRAGVTLLCRYLPHHVLALPRLSPHVAEAEEGERCPIRVQVVLAIWSVAAEIDEARLSGCSVSSYRARRLPKTSRTRLASWKSANAITASSANRTRVLFPFRRGFTSFSNHSSSTWCRKTFDRQGEITPPCGEPSVAWRRSPSSSTPAFSHLSIILRMTPSVTRLSRNERRWECDIDPK